MEKGFGTTVSLTTMMSLSVSSTLARVQNLSVSASVRYQPLVLVVLMEQLLTGPTALADSSFVESIQPHSHHPDAGGGFSPTSSSSWMAAQQLVPPQVSASESGEDEGGEWWVQHEALLQQAWKEWEQTFTTSGSITENYSPQHHPCGGGSLPPLNASLIDPDLFTRVSKVWDDPTLHNEDQIKELWSTSISLSPELAAGVAEERLAEQQVYQYSNLLTREGIVAVRCHLDAIANSGIPIRRPNGMNRYGVLLDHGVPGGVGKNVPLVQFLDLLVDDFIRPLGRMFFPTHAGSYDDDAHYYAFTIRYSAEEDTKLKEHSDASVISLNLNLNLPHEHDYGGSAIYFVTELGQQQGEQHRKEKGGGSGGAVLLNRQQLRQELRFEPGTALLHRGMVRHAATSISRGSRQNLVIWLYGTDGVVRFAPYGAEEQLSVLERWSKTTSSSSAGTVAGTAAAIVAPCNTRFVGTQCDMEI
jgi:hypothetical protein